MYGCESWTIKEAECQRIDAFELWCWRRLESPLNNKKIKPDNPKENKFWIFIGRTDAEVEAPIMWSPDRKTDSGKDSDTGKDWGQVEKATEDKTVGWHHWLNGHEFEQVQGDSEGQRSLVCCTSLGLTELDMAWPLKNNSPTFEPSS